MAIELDEAEKKALESYFSSPQPEEKHNVHTFLHNVATSKDTTKTGNLKEEEIGKPLINARTLKGLALISDKILDSDFLKTYFEARSEILTSTSLSKDATLIKLAVVQRRELADLTKPERKENKGWFKKKNQEPEIKI